MIGALNLEQSILQPQNQSQKSHNSNDKNFENVLDRSLSDQKSLQHENKQTEKLAKQQKSLEKLENILEFIQEQNPEISTENMMEIISTLNVTMDEVESLDEEMSAMIDAMLGLLEQGLIELQESGVINPEIDSMMDKFLFVMDGDDSLPKVATERPMVFENIIDNIQHLVQKIEQATESVSQSSPKQVAEVNYEISSGIELGSNFEIVEEGSEIIAEFREQDTESVSQEKGSDLSQNSESDQEQIFSVLDKRTVKKSQATNSVPESLETIDKVFSEHIPKPQSIHTENFAPKTYSAFSSALSRVHMESLMQHVSGKMAVVLQDGGNEMRMKLTPPELGQMKLSFVSEDGIMRGKVVVETPEARMFFEQNIDNLRESLAKDGINLSEVNIEMGSHRDFQDKESFEEQNSYQAIRETGSLNNVREPVMRNRLEDTLVDFMA